jgi:hypothetical protein
MCHAAPYILDGVDDLEKELSKMMSHEEIMRRFRKVFGRDMTPIERQVFFLEHGSSEQGSDKI